LPEKKIRSAKSPPKVFFTENNFFSKPSIAVMFSSNSSYIAILRDIAQQCCLPYISCIHEVIQDGTHLYGIEIELPFSVLHTGRRTLFFWGHPHLEEALAYEAAAFQAIIALQRLYGSAAVDYSVHGLHMYRAIAQRLLPIANRGTQLARLVIAASEHPNVLLPALEVCARLLLDEVAAIPHGSAL